MAALLFMVTALPGRASENQKRGQKRQSEAGEEQRKLIGSTPVNDSQTPLHLLAPDYELPYAEISVSGIRSDIDRVLEYLVRVTPTEVEDKETGETIDDNSRIDAKSRLRRGDFRLTSYEWGVVYSGMLRMAAAASDDRYSDYAYSRMKFLGQMAKYFHQPLLDAGLIDPQMRQILEPESLDDAGSVCAALIQAYRATHSEELRPLIDNFINFILY